MKNEEVFDCPVCVYGLSRDYLQKQPVSEEEKAAWRDYYNDLKSGEIKFLPEIFDSSLFKKICDNYTDISVLQNIDMYPEDCFRLYNIFKSIFSDVKISESAIFWEFVSLDIDANWLGLPEKDENAFLQILDYLPKFLDKTYTTHKLLKTGW